MRKLILLFVIFLSSFSLQAQCAMCKAVVENGDVSMAESINSGISYLMVFPYLLVGFLLLAIYRYRKGVKD